MKKLVHLHSLKLDEKTKMSKKQFRDFKSSREFVRSLKLKKVVEWQEYCRNNQLPSDIPLRSDYVYKNKGWIGWGDFLGTGNISSKDMEFRNFESAREFARLLKLKSYEEWNEYCKSGDKPEDIPSHPQGTYKNKGWIGWGDFLGTGNVHKKEFRDFESAREFVRELNIEGNNEWREYCKSGNKPEDIPSAPELTYKNNGWIGYGDWLGTGNISTIDLSKQYLSFSEAREEARRLAKKYNIKNWKDWQNAIKKGLIPKNIPSNPNNTYGKKRKKNG